MPTPPYLNDTLRWAAAEIRFPVLDKLDRVPEDFQKRLRDLFPVQETSRQLTLSVGPNGPTSQDVPQHRFLRRDRLASVSLGREAVSLETTDYPGWTEFRETLGTVLDALAAAECPQSVLRVGLRYMDEIRVPSPPSDAVEWNDWVDGRLVGPFTVTDAQPLNAGAIVLQFGTAPGYVTIFRAAPFETGRTVQVDGPLRAPFATPDGPYFLLDCDASWADPNGTFPEFLPTEILATLDTLKTSCVALFESSITDKLRREVLSRPREEMAHR